MSERITESRSSGELARSEMAHEAPLRTIPNQLTILRLLLSVVFFVLVGLLGHGIPGPEYRPLVLNISAAVFILAVITDALDGHLARRWRQVSTFGRIADPFVDKILVCGALIMLIGVSKLIEAWYTLVIVFREFLVSGIRSFMESRGRPFGAALSGKLKMVLQSFAIPAVLLYEANLAADSPVAAGENVLRDAAYWTVVALLAATLAVTVFSLWVYLHRATKLLREAE